MPKYDLSGIPRLVAHCDVTRLPLTAIEGFVFSRIDGSSRFSDLSAMTGLPADEIGRIVAHLHELGAVNVDGWLRPESVAAPTPPPPEYAPSPSPVTARVSGIVSTAPLRYDPAELEVPSDLDRELRVAILELYARLDDLDFYTLLGLPRDADRKAVKSAYYALAALFHTDRYPGKDLGAFKAKMEQIFGRVTFAHDTLANRQKRAEYDAYLQELEKTRAFEDMLTDSTDEDTQSVLVLVRARAFGTREQGQTVPPTPSPSGATSAAPLDLLRPPPGAGPSMRPMLKPPERSLADTLGGAAIGGQPASPSMSPQAGPLTPEQERARREVLARRLGGSRGGRPSTPSQAVVNPGSRSDQPAARTPATPEQAKAAGEALKRRFDEAGEAARRAQARKLIEAAHEALAADDVVRAANQYRLALRYTDDPEVAREFEAIAARAQTVLAEAYLNQGRYEEQNERWSAAALSYAKASKGRPDDPELADRAANAFRREGRDLHLAARFAETAVQKNPSKAAFRVTLAQVYLDAGLVLRARGELEQAAKLAPTDVRIKELLVQARQVSVSRPASGGSQR